MEKSAVSHQGKALVAVKERLAEPLPHPKGAAKRPPSICARGLLWLRGVKSRRFWVEGYTMDEKLLVKCRLGGSTYEFFGELDGDVFEPRVERALQDGEPTDSFGTSWAGMQHTALDAVCAAFAAFINGDESVEFIDVCPEVEALKAQQTFTDAGGRSVPNAITTPFGETADLVAVAGDGKAYYIRDGELCICTGSDGSVLTDVEPFFTSAFLDDVRDDNMVFMTPEGEEFAELYAD